MITKMILEKRILWAAIEEYAGLWEIIWEFGNEIIPVHFSEIQTSVIELLKKGYIELFRCKDPEGYIIRINDCCIDILTDKINWDPPDPFDFTIRISATESGENYYKSLIHENP
jgi:hypothetical protein